MQLPVAVTLFTARRVIAERVHAKLPIPECVIGVQQSRLNTMAAQALEHSILRSCVLPPRSAEYRSGRCEDRSLRIVGGRQRPCIRDGSQTKFAALER